MPTYESRPVSRFGTWHIGEWTLKVYGISYARANPREELVEAAQKVVQEYLATHPTKLQHYGVGFVGIHDGRGENQVFLDRWVNENELLHRYWVSPVENPTALHDAPEDHNSVCVWDLFVQSIERQYWIEHFLKSGNLEAYIAAGFDGLV